MRLLAIVVAFCAAISSSSWGQTEHFNDFVGGLSTATPSGGDSLYLLQGGTSKKVPWSAVQAGPVPFVILYAANYTGATISDQILACLNALPAGGGVCDARGIPSGGNWGAATFPQSDYLVLMPCGVFTNNGTLQLFNAAGISGAKWKGCGGSFTGGTLLVWTGNTTGPQFRIRGVQNSIFSDFGTQQNAAFPLSGGASFQMETATGTVSTHRIFQHIYVNGVNGQVAKGFRWCTGGNCGSGGAGPDNNNDLDVLDDVQVVNYSNCAYSIGGTQSIGHVFTASTVFQSNGFGQRGVCTTQETITSGSFSWYGSAGGGSNGTADFDIGSPNSKIVIRDCNLEASSRLLLTAQDFGIPFPVSIDGCRWAADNLNADGNMVLYRAGGPLSFTNNIQSLGAPAAVSPAIMIARASGGTAAGYASRNLFTWGTSAVTNQPFLSTGASLGSEQYWTTNSNIMSDVSTTNYFNVPNLTPPSPGLLVANLPTCNATTQGTRQFVTNQATAVAYHGAVTGGGSTKQNVTCDGTNWYQD